MKEEDRAIRLIRASKNKIMILQLTLLTTCTFDNYSQVHVDVGTYNPDGIIPKGSYSSV